VGGMRLRVARDAVRGSPRRAEFIVCDYRPYVVETVSNDFRLKGRDALPAC
jgi:hypothetical protein